MDDRSKLILIRGIKSGAFSDRQKLEAVRAIKADDDNKAADLIGSLQFATLNSGKSLEDLVNERQGRDRDNFDYSSGADGRLRSLMSFGETDQDREAILASLVGDDGYVRDPSGQLALTEAGQRARGMDPIGKNLIIEDEGFSLRDISEFAGAVPETVGSIAGAIAGGGLTFGIGSVAGAAGGAAVGQAIEETIEQLLGVQTQGLGEVARDVAIEGAIGAGGELLGAAVVTAGRGVLGAGRGIAGKISGRAPLDELADTRRAQMQGLVDRDYVPSLEALGAPRGPAYFQKVAETTAKVTDRIDNNLNRALSEKQDFLQGIKGDPVSELGEDVMRWYAPSQLSKLKKNRDIAQKSILKAIDDSIDLLSTANKENFDLNAQSLGKITKAFKSFGDKSAENFTNVDTMLSQIQRQIPDPRTGRPVQKTGGQLKIFDVRGMQSGLKDYMEEMRNLADPAAEQIDIFLRGTKGDATFTDMANVRKAINDSLYFGPNVATKARGKLENLRSQIDFMMDQKNILDQIDVSSFTPNELQIFKAAAEQRKFAMSQFKEGMKKFEDLANLGVINSVRDLASFEGYPPRAISDKFADKVIKDNSPQRLQAVLDATNNSNELQDAFARSYLENALSASRKSTLDDAADPNEFDGKIFRRQIKKLGTTGPKLFGEDWNAVKKLADEIGASNLKKSITVDDVNRIANLSDGPIVQGMRNLLDSQTQLNNALKTSVIKDIDAGKFENYDSVVRALTNPKLTQDEVTKIMRFFDNSPQLQSSMRDVVLQDILSSVDENIFKTPQSSESLLKVLESYKPGVLKKVLGKIPKGDEILGKAATGEEYYSDVLYKFANDLKALGDVGKEGSIASGTLWAKFMQHPINALLTVGKFRTVAKGLGNPTVARGYLKASRAASGDPVESSNAILGVLNEAAMNEGIDLAGSASKASKIATSVGRVGGQAARIQQQTYPRALGLTTQQRKDTTRTNARPASPKIPNIPIPEVRMPTLPAQPAGPIQQLQRNVQSEIRRRARENPAVAATLLGGLGSAGLL